GIVALMIKIVFFIFLFMWVRWTIPRFRYDQLMNLGWKKLVPLALANMLITGAVILWLQK
ncbi:MAG: NADH-quinone oxidoreductase subunit H, partial [Bacteroidota bacterium]|nr:NADH-quinone oxidoreductase subunit H [Bacteroidota bacterium]